MSENLKFPKPAPRRVTVVRNPTPTVNRMLDDAYHVLAAQLGLFRGEAHTETFTIQKASAFCKLVTSLTSLQQTEIRRTSLMNLNNLSDEELQALDGPARAILGLDAPTRDDT